MGILIGYSRVRSVVLPRVAAIACLAMIGVGATACGSSKGSGTTNNSPSTVSPATSPATVAPVTSATTAPASGGAGF